MAKRTAKFPVKITMKHFGKGGITRPTEGDHFSPANDMGIIAAYSEGAQLKYWRINGEIIRENPYKFRIGTEDIYIEAHFGQKKQPTGLEEAGKVIEKDISAVAGIDVKHAKDSSGRKHRRLS